MIMMFGIDGINLRMQNVFAEGLALRPYLAILGRLKWRLSERLRNSLRGELK